MNHAKIVESEVFVYNLGTMYYIDDVLYPDVLESTVKQTDLPPTTASPSTTFSFKYTTSADIEQIPAELVTESNDDGRKDILLQDTPNDDDDEEEEDDDEIVTPRVLPVYFMEPPKK